MMDVNLQINQDFADQLSAEAIEHAAKRTVQKVTFEPQAGEVNIIITDDHMIQQLNHQYRGIDAPTDVLSFENVVDADFPAVDPSTNTHLGDVIIAYPVARRQAAAEGHSPQEEVVLLTVHGMLHLLGFDHDTPANKEEMWAAQQQVMAQLGLAHIQPTEN